MRISWDEVCVGCKDALFLPAIRSESTSALGVAGHNQIGVS